MKTNILSKYLPIAAAILLATSCSKDGDNDNNVVNNPDTKITVTPVSEPQHYTLDFTLTVSNATSLSKVGYPSDLNGTIAPEFENTDVLTITAGTTVVANIGSPAIADGNHKATFTGSLDFGTDADLKAAVESGSTKLVASIGTKTTAIASYNTLADALTSCSYYESTAFDYVAGGVDNILLVNRYAFIEFNVADGQKKVNVNSEWYPSGDDVISGKYICVAVPVDGASASVSTRFKKNAKDVEPGTIYTINSSDVVDLGLSVLWCTSNANSPETEQKNWKDARLLAASIEGYDLPSSDNFKELTGQKIVEGVTVKKTWKSTGTGVEKGYTFSTDYGEVFFPAAGYDGGIRAGTYGNYWSATSVPMSSSTEAYALTLYSVEASVTSDAVEFLYSVRLVRSL
ncbi:MAG: hypothetical protein J6T60_02175 [Bacteroidales bacterium]|nr:hypothetical protein [Bacteroidales bacterium]